MNYIYLLNHKELFPSVIGVTHRQFELLLPKFSYALRIAEHKKAYEKKRQREVGGGRKPTLKTDRQKLFFILFYYKVYPTFRFNQAIFEFDKRNTQIWKEFLEPVLFEALGHELELPERKINSMVGLITICPDLKQFIVDAAERPVRRPKDPKDQTKYYSGKKKRHTVKNQITISPKSKRILSVSLTVEGKLHDKKLFEKDPTVLRAPPKAKGLGDLGYEGVRETNPLISFITPFKKPRGKELSETQKITNKTLSSVRVSVEHVLAYMKHFNILSHTFRNRIPKADQPFVNIACLYNFTRSYR
ncbi:transposase family protein [Candidatus Gottesmanbacteria bacterium]|nr:transposase family protein [Candidatus Gottesmanbacteria bacterium]